MDSGSFYLRLIFAFTNVASSSTLEMEQITTRYTVRGKVQSFCLASFVPFLNQLMAAQHGMSCFFLHHQNASRCSERSRDVTLRARLSCSFNVFPEGPAYSLLTPNLSAAVID